MAPFFYIRRMSMGATLLDEHREYLSDPLRHALLQRATAALIQPGQRVVDLGCGSGILGLLCLQHGADFVEAIEQTSMIEAARESFRRAGFATQVRLHHASSFRVKLDQPADVIVCDHVGFFGIDYGLLELLADARARFLKPSGRILPRRVQLLVGAVSSDTACAVANAWADARVAPEFHWLRSFGVNSKHPLNFRADEMLSDLKQIADLELGYDFPSVLSWNCEIVVTRDGLLDGLAGCFRAELTEDVWMTNSPLAADAIARAQAFLPISERLPVRAGDLLSIAVRQCPRENLVAWQVLHPASGRRFAHSTFAGQLLTQRDLTRRRMDRRPTLSRDGAARQTVLNYATGLHTAAEIEDLVLREHPELYPSTEEIRRFVARTLLRDAD